MRTIVPGRALLKMDLRLVADQDPDDIFEKFRSHVRVRAPYVSVRRTWAMHPSRTAPDLPVSEVVVAAVQQLARGQDAVVIPAIGGSLPDCVWTKILGVPSIIVPYANADQSNHAPNENLEIRAFYKGIETTAYVIDALGRFG